MTIIRNTLILFLSVFTMVSCKHSTDNHDMNEVEIELNEGEKWTVNAEMKPYVMEAEQIISAYDGGDHALLAEKLAEQNQALVKSCTMEGKSHEELHKWLHPHMELVSDLGEAESQEAADEIIADIKQSFGTYHKYFK